MRLTLQLALCSCLLMAVIAADTSDMKKVKTAERKYRNAKGEEVREVVETFEAPGSEAKEKRPLPNAYWFENNKVLLYSIDANNGESAYRSFMFDMGYAAPSGDSWPSTYRSPLLNNLKAAVSTGSWQMVAEMRKGNKMVAQVVFDVTKNRNALNIRNWFSASRVVSSFPYSMPKKFNFFSVDGHRSIRRRFFINERYHGCGGDVGFWAVIDKRDVCPWGHRGWKGRTPVLAYNKMANTRYQSGNVGYADRFLIYLLRQQPAARMSAPKYLFRPAFQFESNKLLLFTVAANSGIRAYEAFQKPKTFMRLIPSDNSLPLVYRSDFLDSLPKALSSNSKKQIVAEMRKNGKVVSKVVFNAAGNINKNSWFSKNRIVSSFPYAIGRRSGYNIFGTAGHVVGTNVRRRFFISFAYGGCHGDRAFFTVLDTRDGCPWGHRGWKGQNPTLVYSVNAHALQKGAARYADRFLVYMQ